MWTATPRFWRGRPSSTRCDTAHKILTVRLTRATVVSRYPAESAAAQDPGFEHAMLEERCSPGPGGCRSEKGRTTRSRPGHRVVSCEQCNARRERHTHKEHVNHKTAVALCVQQGAPYTPSRQADVEGEAGEPHSPQGMRPGHDMVPYTHTESECCSRQT